MRIHTLKTNINICCKKAKYFFNATVYDISTLYKSDQLSLISDGLELYDVSEGTLIFVIYDVFAVTYSIL